MKKRRRKGSGSSGNRRRRGDGGPPNGTMGQYRVAADPHAERQQQLQESKSSGGSAGGAKGKGGFGSLITQFKKKLGITEIPDEMLEKEELDLKVWSALIDDRCLRKVARKSKKREDEYNRGMQLSLGFQAENNGQSKGNEDAAGEQNSEEEKGQGASEEKAPPALKSGFSFKSLTKNTMQSKTERSVGIRGRRHHFL